MPSQKLIIEKTMGSQIVDTFQIDDPRTEVIRLYNATNSHAKYRMRRKKTAIGNRWTHFATFSIGLLLGIAGILLVPGPPTPDPIIKTVIIPPAVDQSYLIKCNEELTIIRAQLGWTLLPKKYSREFESEIITRFKRLSWWLKRPGEPTPRQWMTSSELSDASEGKPRTEGTQHSSKKRRGKESPVASDRK